MKQILIVLNIFFVIVFSCSIVLSQSTFSKSINYELLDYPNHILAQDTFFYTVNRYSDGTIEDAVEQILTKWTQSGQLVWNLTFSDSQYSVYEGPALSSPNAIYLSFVYTNKENDSIRVYKIDKKGDISWISSFPSIIDDTTDYGFRFYKIVSLPNDELRLYFRMGVFPPGDSSILKNGYLILDRNGIEVSRTFLDKPNKYEWPLGVIHYKDLGYLKEHEPDNEFYLVRNTYEFFDNADSLIWSYEIGPIDHGGGFGPIAMDSVGNTYFTCLYDTSGNNNIFRLLPTIFSLDDKGKLRWKKAFGERIGTLLFTDIICQPNGQIIACGYEGNAHLSGGNYRVSWIVCVDKDGNKLWERRYIFDEATDAGNDFYKVIPSEDKGLIFTGKIFPDSIPEYGGTDVLLVKTDMSGCLNPDCGLYNFVTISTSIVDPNENSDIQLIQIEDKLHVVCAENMVGTSYLIYSLDGRKIRNGIIPSTNSQVDLYNLLPGLYIFQVLKNSTSQPVAQVFLIMN